MKGRIELRVESESKNLQEYNNNIYVVCVVRTFIIYLYMYSTTESEGGCAACSVPGTSAETKVCTYIYIMYSHDKRALVCA